MNPVDSCEACATALGEAGCGWRGSGPAAFDVDVRAEGSVVTGPGERLVTVVLTVAVPAEADAEDAAGLVADAAVSTALQVVSAAGVEGHLPVPGSLVLRRGGDQPWRVEAVSKEFATLTDLGGAVVQTPLTRLAPDPLAASGEGCPGCCAGRRVTAELRTRTT